jgi:hypothetical protein
MFLRSFCGSNESRSSGQGREAGLVCSSPPYLYKAFRYAVWFIAQKLIFGAQLLDISQSALQSSHVVLRPCCVLFIPSQRIAHGLKAASPLQ